jgi:peptidoglycan-associated lipoprotein
MGANMRAKLTLVTVAAGLVLAAACGGPPPEPPAPVINQDSIDEANRISDSIAEAQRIADSIAREQQRLEDERVRLEREEADRREAMTNRVLTLLANVINFDFDRSNIRPGRDTEVLEMKLRILQENSALSIQITGHCDERGSDEYNMSLGNRRAIAAMEWLFDRGIEESRITVRSMGEEEPVNTASNEEAWAQNRRDEFTITAGGTELVLPQGM